MVVHGPCILPDARFNCLVGRCHPVIVLRYHSIGLPVVEVPFPAPGSGIVVAVGYDVVVVRIREANADDVVRVSGVVPGHTGVPRRSLTAA